MVIKGLAFTLIAACSLFRIKSVGHNPFNYVTDIATAGSAFSFITLCVNVRAALLPALELTHASPANCRQVPYPLAVLPSEYVHFIFYGAKVHDNLPQKG